MKRIVIMLFVFLPVSMIAQESGQPTGISKAFEEQDPRDEVARLESKKINLEYRLGQLNQDPVTNADEIVRVNGMIRYIDAKIEDLNKIILSEDYAVKTGAPVQGTMTDEEYQQAKIEWKDSVVNTSQDMQIKTTLTREEFERLPKDRQEKILSMPERYTIID